MGALCVCGVGSVWVHICVCVCVVAGSHWAQGALRSSAITWTPQNRCIFGGVGLCMSCAADLGTQVDEVTLPLSVLSSTSETLMYWLSETLASHHCLTSIKAHVLTRVSELGAMFLVMMQHRREQELG